VDQPSWSGLSESVRDVPRLYQTIDLIVYRPAGGAGYNESRRLRLGGQQKLAGCNKINMPFTPREPRCVLPVDVQRQDCGLVAVLELQVSS
jgi:hypothetical protein